MTKRHHLVPSFLLSNWASDGTRNGRIWAFHRGNDYPIPTKPGDCAVKSNFYTISCDSLDSNAIENIYSILESHSAKIVKKICNENRISELQDRECLLYFLAHQLSRIESLRKRSNDIQVDLLRQVIDLHLSDRRLWERIASSEGGSNLPSFDQARRAFENAFMFEINPNALKAQALNFAKSIYPILRQRPWHLVIAEEAKNRFIISDQPVVVHRVLERWDKFEEVYGPEHDIYCPLSPRLLAISKYNVPDGKVVYANDEEIAQINTITLANANKQCYSYDQSICWWCNESGRVSNWEDLVLTRKKSHAVF